MTDVPHFDIPFRFSSQGHAVEVEQDTEEDVTNCVQLILQTTVGQRIESPGLGIPDEVFKRQPISIGTIEEVLAEQEPRAVAIMNQAPDAFDPLIARLNVQISLRDAGGGS